MQKKIEEIKGLDYCREHCKRSDKYTAMENTARCYWIAKEGEIRDEPQTASP